MVNATQLKVLRTAASLLKGACSQTYWTHKRQPELEAPCSLRWSGPTVDPATERGQMSNYKGAMLMIHAFSKTNVLLGDRGYDANWFRHTPIERCVTSCIPSKTNRKIPIPHDRPLYRQRHRVECSADSRTDDAATYATIAEPNPRSPRTKRSRCYPPNSHLCRHKCLQGCCALRCA